MYNNFLHYVTTKTGNADIITVNFMKVEVE